MTTYFGRGGRTREAPRFCRQYYRSAPRNKMTEDGGERKVAKMKLMATHQLFICQKRPDAPKKADDELWKFWREKVPGIGTDWKFWRAELVQERHLHCKAALQKAALQLDHLSRGGKTCYVGGGSVSFGRGFQSFGNCWKVLVF